MSEAADAVLRLHPIRVLVVSRDLRFVQLTRMLLARRGGFELEVASDRAEALDVIERGTDVVVLDGDGSLRGAARSAGAFRALYPRLGVLLVAERPAGRAPGLVPVLSKWSPGRELVAAIERTYLRLPPATVSPDVR